jgi:tRNA pseudouridine(55) synthase
MPIITLNKNIGQTPKELIEEYKQKNGIKKASYCGRLDPMASGLMLVLTEDDCKKQDKYLKMYKTYEFDMVFGIWTNSHDPLNNNIKLYDEHVNQEEIEKLLLEKYIGNINQKFPLCSSYTIDIGLNKKIPLWEAFKSNLISTDYELPSKSINIKNFEILDYKLISDNELFHQFISDINKVKDVNNNFGKNEALSFYSTNQNNKMFQVFTCKVTGSSGTYIRGLTRDISQDLGKHAIANRIKRISIH